MTKAEIAYQEALRFQQNLADYFRDLRNFMAKVGENHRSLNHAWDGDHDQKDYRDLWNQFEEKFKNQKEVLLHINTSFNNFMHHLGVFVRRPYTPQELVPIQQVEALTAWPASAVGSSLELPRILQILEEYVQLITNFISTIFVHENHLITPLQHIGQCIVLCIVHRHN